MNNFKCDACGYAYQSIGNFTSCPNCGGLGKPNPRCTCRHYRTGMGQVLNLISKEDPECPVHGNKISEKNN